MPDLSATPIVLESPSSTSTIINSLSPSPPTPPLSPSPSFPLIPSHGEDEISQFIRQMLEIQRLRVRFNLEVNFGLLVRRRKADTVPVEERGNVQLILAPSRIPDAGMGVFAAQTINRDAFILEYTGEVMLRGVFEERVHAGQTSGRY
jgi:hypothetical protein